MKEPQYHALPDELSVLVSQHWQHFVESGHRIPDALLDDLPRVWAGSDYVAQQFQRDPGLGQWLEDSDPSGALAEDSLRQTVQEQLAACHSEDELKRTLRRLRHRHMVRIIWRDSCGLADFQETVGDLSHLADACIDGALDKLYGWMEPEFGLPYYHPSPSPSSQQGQPMPMVVLGMGKLGACELNLSSDIDLMFAYAHEGETRGGRRSLAHRDFFTRLGQKLIKALDENTVDGFVFRVDMRLRPYGSSGALALNFRAMESYYEEQGREWERYAMIKARAIGSDNGDGDELLRRLRPFVYRRYVDFGVIGKAKTTYYPNKLRKQQEIVKDGLIADAKKNLQEKANLTNNQAYANLTIDILETTKGTSSQYGTIINEVTIEAVVSADIIEYID